MGVAMDIYEFALQMEKDGENYYRLLMQKCKDGGLKQIFAMLADEEIKHYTLIEQLRMKRNVAEVKDAPILEKVKNIFVTMKEGRQEPQIDTTEETNAYRKARDIEEESRRFYLEKADQVEGKQARSLLLKLAKEEEKHLHIMENIVEFVSRAEPGKWLENAEWHHLEPY
jgi:rubrerythrin